MAWDDDQRRANRSVADIGEHDTGFQLVVLTIELGTAVGWHHQASDVGERRYVDRWIEGGGRILDHGSRCHIRDTDEFEAANESRGRLVGVVVDESNRHVDGGSTRDAGKIDGGRRVISGWLEIQLNGATDHFAQAFAPVDDSVGSVRIWLHDGRTVVTSDFDFPGIAHAVGRVGVELGTLEFDLQGGTIIRENDSARELSDEVIGLE